MIIVNGLICHTPNISKTNIIKAKTHFLSPKFAKVAILTPIKKNGKSDLPCLPNFAKRQFWLSQPYLACQLCIFWIKRKRKSHACIFRIKKIKKGKKTGRHVIFSLLPYSFSSSPFLLPLPSFLTHKSKP